jgi:outer membrane protein OmpA-like peptidoglycan-associated protein
MKSNTKSIATWMAIFPVALLSFTSLAQTDNLVPNGSFESTTNKPKKLGQIELATGWASPTGVRADLFTPAAKVPEIGTPDNAYGTEEPSEGRNYAGIVAYSYNDKVPRSYIMAKLSVPLKKGMKYCVSFEASLSELSKYASNQLGAHIGKKAFGTEAKSSIIEKTHVLHADSKVLNGLFGWDKICGSYVAEGGEKFITIGNFSTNENTKQEKNLKQTYKGTPVIGAYYYIDNVTITLMEEGQKCECEKEEDPDEVSSTIYQKAIVVAAGMTPTQKIELQNAFFAFGKDKLQPAAYTALDIIYNELKANPAMKLQIDGHMDEKEVEKAQEKPQYEGLDAKRAAAVFNYLREKGIPENRLIVNGQGSSTPNAEIAETDEDDLKMAKNRRVSFRVR